MTVFAFYAHDPGWRKGWRDKMIRWATGSDYSHVEYVTEGRVKKHNVCFSASKRDGNRVRAMPITWKPAHWVFVEVQGDDADIYRRIMAEMGKPYDTIGAILSVTPFHWHIPGSWFCSELMAHALQLAGANRFTPGKFMDALSDMGGRVIETEAQERMNRSQTAQ